jgi:hypothetical protein
MQKTLLITAYVMLAGAGQVQAQDAMRLQVPCYDGKSFIEILGLKYHEVLTHQGLTKGGDLIQTYESPEHTFTILRIMPSGTTCIISSGEDWVAEKPQIAGEKL